MKQKHLSRSFQLNQSVAAFLILACLCGGTLESLRAHGSMLDPVSRVYRIFLDNPQTPQNNAARAALTVNGTQPFYDWNEVSRNLPDYDWQANVSDGQLASGGRAKYAGLDLVRSDWAATAVESGPYRLVYHATTPHSPSYFRAFITKADWDPESALAWADFEPLPGAENAALQGNNYAWDTVLPQRAGRHVILVVWQRIDPVGEVFFSVSDVVFGADNGYGGGAVTPGTVYQPEPEEAAEPAGPAGPCSQPLDECHYGADCHLEATFTVVNSWTGGYVANVTLRNQGSTAVNGWTLSLELEGQLVNWWSAVLTESVGPRHTFIPEAWAREITAGGSVTFGLQVNGDPAAGAENMTVNGAAAGGGEVGGGGNPGDGDETASGGDEAGAEVPSGDPVIPPAARAPLRQSVVAYFPSWGIYEKGYEVEHLPADRLTHVIHAFARISPEGEMAVIDPWADLERAIGPDKWDTPLRGNFGAYARLKAAHPHLRVLIAVGGWFDSGRFSEVAATPAARAKFAASVRAFCLQYGFDGVDLDWEYPVVATDVNRNVRPEDGENYALLAGAIRAEFDAQSATDGKRYEITAAMPAGFDKFERINLSALAAQLDLINLMTYDFHGRWIATQTGHNAPLFRSALDPNPRYNTDEAVRGYLAAGVPAAKIALGIPAYGYGWQGVTSPVPFSAASGLGPGTLSVEPGFYDYRTVAALVRANPAAERWDEAAQASYFSNGDFWIGYDSPRALRRKLEYARDLGLGGVMFWEASTDVRGDGADSLIRIASETLAQPSTWQEWTERWWSPEERLNPQLVGEEADPDGDGLVNLLEYAAGRNPLTADGSSILITRWDSETGRFVVRFHKAPGISDLTYDFEARNSLVAGGTWSGVSLEVLTDNEAVLEAADLSAPIEAASRLIRLRITRQ